jgi:hypothetical protein
LHRAASESQYIENHHPGMMYSICGSLASYFYFYTVRNKTNSNSIVPLACFNPFTIRQITSAHQGLNPVALMSIHLGVGRATMSGFSTGGSFAHSGTEADARLKNGSRSVKRGLGEAIANSGTRVKRPARGGTMQRGLRRHRAMAFLLNGMRISAFAFPSHQD